MWPGYCNSLETAVKVCERTKEEEEEEDRRREQPISVQQTTN